MLCEIDKQIRRKRFCKDVSNLVCSFDVFEFDGVVVMEGTKIVIFEMNVFASAMVNGVFRLRDTSCIVFVNDGGSSLSKTEFVKELTVVYNIARGRVSSDLFGFG